MSYKTVTESWLSREIRVLNHLQNLRIHLDLSLDRRSCCNVGTLELESECLWETVWLHSHRRRKFSEGNDGEFGSRGLVYDLASRHVS